jgi:hypothetical protein
VALVALLVVLLAVVATVASIVLVWKLATTMTKVELYVFKVPPAQPY